MADAQAIAAAFRQLQAGNAPAALEAARRITGSQPSNARAHLVAGIALRMLGRLEESRAALARSVALDGLDYAAAYELGLTHEALGEGERALAQFRRATSLRPAFVAAHVSLAHAHVALRQWDAARGAITRALELDPKNGGALRLAGALSAERGEQARAAELFTAALAVAPGDPEISLLLAQVELARGAWDSGWRHYARREQRAVFEREAAAQHRPYRVPALGDIAGREVTLIGEQGLGDILFFLRFAPLLASRKARLNFLGDDRLRPLLERTRLFAGIFSQDKPHAMGTAVPLLVGDLPAVTAGHEAPCPASLTIAPTPEKLERWRSGFEAAGPKPWIGITWRAGTPSAVLARRLFKSVAVRELAGALRSLGGTLVAVQRNPEPGEIAAASEALGRPVHDLSRVNDDLDDALATMSLLDRYVGVSNTNMHLRAAAGKTADVLVPFPPEWRWGIAGESPWFPGFRVHRQPLDGGWAEVLARLA